MRRPGAHLLLIAIALTGASCTNEASVPAFIATSYQVRCGDTCETAESPHQVAAVDGDDDLRLTCRVEGGELAFRLACPGGSEAACGSKRFGLEATNVAIDGAGKITDPGGPCRIKATEGSNSYEGRCTSDDPTEARPCRITGELDGTFVYGTIICQDFSNPVNGSDKRWLVDPTVSSDKPLEFTLEGCEGL